MYQATKYSTHDLDILCPQNLPPWSDLQALYVPIALAFLPPGPGFSCGGVLSAYIM